MNITSKPAKGRIRVAPKKAKAIPMLKQVKTKKPIKNMLKRQLVDRLGLNNIR
jgi:hypothetical protein